jgi:Zn-dependent protease
MAAAGPGANLALAVAALLFLKIGLATGLFLELDWVKPSRLVAGDVDWIDGMGRFTSMMLYLNTVLCLLNLMPLPPLDGASAHHVPPRKVAPGERADRQLGFAMVGLSRSGSASAR